MITTTLKRIREHGPSEDCWNKLLTYLGKTKADDEPLPFAVIVESNGITDALWCCRAEPQHSKEWRLYAVWCVRQVKHLLPDERSKNALAVAERHAHGLATDDELNAAYSAAYSAACEAETAARDLAWAACYATRGTVTAALDAAWAACDATYSAARTAAWAAVRTASRYAAWAAACAAPSAAERTEAWDAAWDAQTQRFLEIVGARGGAE